MENFKTVVCVDAESKKYSTWTFTIGKTYKLYTDMEGDEFVIDDLFTPLYLGRRGDDFLVGAGKDDFRFKVEE